MLEILIAFGQVFRPNKLPLNTALLCLSELCLLNPVPLCPAMMCAHNDVLLIGEQAEEVIWAYYFRSKQCLVTMETAVGLKGPHPPAHKSLTLWTPLRKPILRQYVNCRCRAFLLKMPPPWLSLALTPNKFCNVRVWTCLASCWFQVRDAEFIGQRWPDSWHFQRQFSSLHILFSSTCFSFG